jgi:hypothetical protein
MSDVRALGTEAPCARLRGNVLLEAEAPQHPAGGAGAGSTCGSGNAAAAVWAAAKIASASARRWRVKAIYPTVNGDDALARLTETMKQMRAAMGGGTS